MDIIDIKNIMDVMNIVDIMYIMDIRDIMDIMDFMDVMDIMTITAWMAMASAVSTLPIPYVNCICLDFCFCNLTKVLFYSLLYIGLWAGDLE